jgi:sulfide:quinone oxidoreductase
MAHVVILGGGFGGLAAANELRTILPEGDDVTLVDRAGTFFMGFAKLWDLARTRPLTDGTASLDALHDRGVRFLHSDITAIDPAARRVETDAATLDADAILVALGAGPSPKPRAHLDAHPHAHDLYDATCLPAIHHDLDTVDHGRVVVAILGGPFKCPPAPYEAVLIVDERLRARGVRDDVAVTIVTPQPMTLPVAGVDASRYIADHLGEHDVGLQSGQPVTAVDDGHLTLADDTTIEWSVLLGVPATAPPPVIAPLVGPSGWIEPDRHTLRTQHERVYAVGDCTQIPTATAQLPKAGVFAAAQGVVAARNIAADLGVPGAAGDRFEGHGFCFLELPGENVAFVEGNFYADPAPDVTLTPADHEQYRRKQEYERARLSEWLG